jgi:hypothetical protein
MRCASAALAIAFGVPAQAAPAPSLSASVDVSTGTPMLVVDGQNFPPGDLTRMSIFYCDPPDPGGCNTPDTRFADVSSGCTPGTCAILVFDDLVLPFPDHSISSSLPFGCAISGDCASASDGEPGTFTARFDVTGRFPFGSNPCAYPFYIQVTDGSGQIATFDGFTPCPV